MLIKHISLCSFVCLSTNLSLHAMQQPPLRDMDYALIAAAKDNDIRGINKQLQLGAKINAKSSTTPLLAACTLKDNNETLVAVLLENEADPNLPYSEGTVAMHLAAENNNVPVLELLEQAGGDLNALDSNGNTLCHRAVPHDAGRTISWLNARDVNLNTLNKAGLAPLHLAVLNQKMSSTAYLLRQDVRIDTKTAAHEQPKAHERLLPAGSTVFHTSTAMEAYEAYKPYIQGYLVSHALFKTAATSITPQALTTFLCCLRNRCPDLYHNCTNLLLPYLSKHFSVQKVTSLLTSDKKHLADFGRKILKQRSIQLQRILQEKDSNGQTAVALETARNVLNNIQSAETLLDPVLYDLHFTPFVAAMRTETVDQLPDKNVFKIAYIEAMPRKVEESQKQTSTRVWGISTRSPLGRLINAYFA